VGYRTAFSVASIPQMMPMARAIACNAVDGGGARAVQPPGQHVRHAFWKYPRVRRE
jgi:hypothetical protein